MAESSQLKTVTFSRVEFRGLLQRESKRCVEVAIEKKWLIPVPLKFKYYLSAIDRRFKLQDGRFLVPETTLLEEETLLPHIHRENDGWFRSEIVLSPHSLIDEFTVIDVRLRDDQWVNSVIVGELAFPCEPFQLRGPALPPTWREGDPSPMATLELLEPVAEW